MAVARAVVCNRYGVKLAELDGDLSSASWVQNRIGKAVYSISKTSPKATVDNLRLFNRLYLEFDNGLPAWAGLIVPGRRWAARDIRLTLKDGLFITSKRRTDASRSFESTPAGTIFQTLIEEANQVEDMGIEIGTIWTGGPARSPAPYHYTVLSKAIDRLIALTGCDLALVPYISSANLLRFTAHWYEERGEDRPGVALIEDHNARVLDFEEQGPVANSWAGIGAGATWSEKITATDQDSASRAQYGLLEDTVAYPSVSVQDTLDAHVAELLESTRQPWTRIKLEVLDQAPATFASYDVGDRVLVQLHSYGFSGSGFGYEGAVRVLGRDFDATRNTCTLVVEEAEFKT